MLWMVLLLVQTPAQPAPSAEAVKLTPSTSLQFELGKNGVKGSKLERLAWSADRTELYLMTYEPNKDATIKEAFHYVMQITSGEVKSVKAAPEWAETYWAWKSDRSAPGDPSLALKISEERKRAENGVATPMGGDYARGGTGDASATAGMSSAAAMDAARGMQFQNVITLTLSGETVGEWINHRFQPGLTFGWGPKNSGLIAFAAKGNGQLVIMDRTGKKQKIDGTKGVLLPAWTDDGTRLAYLEIRSKNKYEVIVADVK